MPDIETEQQEVQTEGSLRDAISAAYDEASGEPAARETPTETPADTTPAKEPPAAETEPPVKPTTEKPAETPTPEVDEHPIPERLKSTLGEKWTTLPSDVRAAFRSYETNIGRIADRYGKDAKAWNTTMEVFSPYAEMVEKEGGNFHGAVANLFETARILRQGSPAQKVHLVNEIIRSFGVPYGQQAPVTGGDQPPTAQPAAPAIPDPAFIDRFNMLERQVLTTQATAQHNLRATVNSEIESYLSRPDRPYLQEPGYLATMASLINSGKAQNLDEAYNSAAWLHEGTRTREIARLNAERAASQASQVVRAKSAAVSVPGNATGTVRRDPSKMSLRDTLAAAYDGELE